MFMKGWKYLSEFLIDRIQKSYLSIEWVTKQVNVHHIKDAMAIVVFEYQTQYIKRDTREPYGIQGLETQVIVKEN